MFKLTTKMVNMPVEAISEKCLTCPELDVNVITTEHYELASPEEGATSVTKSTYENRLRCVHCNRCAVIFNHAYEDEKKTTTKKITTKKTVAKK